VVGSGVLERSGALLEKLGFDGPPLLVSSRQILDLHGQALVDGLGRRYGSVAVVRMPDGERAKNHSTLRALYDGLFEARADRRSWLVAFGGGVVGDVAGFAAATFLRGIRYVNVPTTLLAQVDSAIGGKVGINVPQGKNLVGAFHQPGAVLSDAAVLQTLPERELASGLFEVVKYAAIRSERLLRYLEAEIEGARSRRPEVLERVVWESARIKSEIVSGDEREGGERMALNFGHTVGHALEAATRYRRFTHGEAVGWGMIAALGFGRELGLLGAAEAGRLETLIRRVAPLPPLGGVALDAVWEALGRDKKFRSGSIRMVLLPRLGASRVRADVDPAHLRRYLERFLAAGRRRPAAGARRRPQAGA
jgi:3-dehydroquinate synthase